MFTESTSKGELAELTPTPNISPKTFVDEIAEISDTRNSPICTIKIDVQSKREKM